MLGVGGNPEGGGGGEVAVDGVCGRVDGDAGVVEIGCALAGVGHAGEVAGFELAGDEGAAEEPLEVEDEVDGGEFFQQAAEAECGGDAAEAAHLAAREEDRRREVGVVGEEWSPLGIDDPADVEVGVGAFDVVDGGEGVDDVAERGGFDDDERRGRREVGCHYLPWFRRSASMGGRPASTILRWVVARSYSMRWMAISPFSISKVQ